MGSMIETSSPFALHSRLHHQTPPINPNKLLLLHSPHSTSIQAKKPLDISQLQEGLQSVTSSLSLLSETIGNALAESFSVIESRSSCESSPQSTSQISQDQSECITNSSSTSSKSLGSSDAPSPGMQLKPSRDLAMAMASKAKLLLRELKTVRAELSFMKSRTTQLEEENKNLRTSMDKGVSPPDEEDLVRRQLETLLAEKARLVQENATYKRENQFLHEAIEYHRLTVQRMVLPEDCLRMASNL